MFARAGVCHQRGLHVWMLLGDGRKNLAVSRSSRAARSAFLNMSDDPCLTGNAALQARPDKIRDFGDRQGSRQLSLHSLS
jgi:hypothetical protein